MKPTTSLCSLNERVSSLSCILHLLLIIITLLPNSIELIRNFAEVSTLIDLPCSVLFNSVVWFSGAFESSRDC